MRKEDLMNLLNGVRDGRVTPGAALEKLQVAPFEDLGYAKIDRHRGMRQGATEVIYGHGKTGEQIIGIVKSMLADGGHDIIITGLSSETADRLAKFCRLEYHPIPRFGLVNKDENKLRKGAVVVVSGGTSDMPVCEEAALTAETMGSKVTRLYDVGVAGLHRLLAQMPTLIQARVVVAVAGMEGALPSVVGGLVSCPVIAVPTSVGYGANLGGMAALLSMLNSCASGVSVVNIDNGFGAGFLAHRVNSMEGLGEWEERREEHNV